jgi:hypothetical protein
MELSSMTDSHALTGTLTAIQQAIEQDARTTPVNRLMRDNYEWFAALFSRRRPNWDLLSTVLAEQGYVREDGSPVSKHTLRSIWSREKARRAKLGKPKPASKRLQTIAQPLVPELGSSLFPDEASTALDDVLAEMNKRSGRSNT